MKPETLQTLQEALRKHHWNVSAVARYLEVDRSTVHRRMRRFGLVPPHKRNFLTPAFGRDPA